MVISKFYPSNQIKFLFLLIILYFILPIFGSIILGEDFYIYSIEEKSAKEPSLMVFGLLILSYYYMVKTSKSFLQEIQIKPLSKTIIYICFIMFIFLIIVLFINGVYQRIFFGSDRNYLLDNLHTFLFPGVSFIIIGALIYIVSYIKKRTIFVIIVIFIVLDLLYMGKKFTYYGLAVLFYYYDKNNTNNGSKNFYYIILFGFLMIIATFILRYLAVSADESTTSVLFGFYTFTSEFLGVYSTIGHAIANAALINDTYVNLDQVLAKYYLPKIGHGLALHPIAYFVVVFKEYWIFFMIIFLMLLYILFRIFTPIIGSLFTYILVVNIVHFTRHGPDVFLKQFITQLVFVSIIFLLPKLLRRIKCNENTN